MIKKILEKWWPLIVITGVIFAFHIRLFLPEPSIYITPDYGRSDAWHLSIANKFYYAQELKKNRIPIWNPHIGTGYPTLAEGQTAIFFLPNLIFFRTLPFVWAYNLTLVLSFLIAGWGIYMFCRSLGLSKLSSTYAGTIFPLGGFFVFHVQHHNLLQTATLLPWLFWATNEFLEKRKVIFLLALSFIISQQIFAGFPQLTFYSLVALVVFLILKTFTKKNWLIKSLTPILISIIFGFSIGAVQVIPQYEFLNVSARQISPENILTRFPYTFKNILQFLNPFILGSPKDGTFPRWVPGSWGIFWENVAYVGIFPLIFALVAIILTFRKKFNQKIAVIIFLFLLLLSLLLALGTLSPLQTVFSLPPFSIFRVPSRFLLITQFSIVVLSAIFIHKTINKRSILIPIILISLLNVFIVFINYNPTGNAKEWFKKPSTSNYLENNGAERIYSIGQSEQWNQEFIFNGWQNNTDYYHFARNSLDQNSNLIFDIDQFASYESMTAERAEIFKQIVNSGINKTDNKIEVSEKSAQLLASSNVTHLISPLEINSPLLKKVQEYKQDIKQKFIVSALKLAPQQYFMTQNYRVAQIKSDVVNNLMDPDFNPLEEIVLEKDINLSEPLVNKWTIITRKEIPNAISFEINSDGEGLFVLTESYYPGWKAFTDEIEVEVLAANINSKAVVIPKGTHLLEFKYDPKSIRLGTTITSLGLIIFIFFFLKFRKFQIL
ncbi:hypothetical protein A3J17_04075 [Candidatus Curtissbacteria bacterium RIFCSPLOWO2_02_FULL_40_11]|uniref:Membrane protein 6-pyruvoyl-tetrahydropterin synthase-related domain-containing protein n=1 Tax=Candidatus Curtissbacteria bacterium RIFCSPLOWO2_12_FULL_38_9 TaxID=1797735 RepID=A0A1F5I7A1_9BACT|nr:MAG: hypothetical protein A3J17_04075 [Candidatus Curtissbacteria bacterium RIFCSPLOWO2_02_FULL_40_11]OGE12195.1 MAG: hypothetical protein A3G14_01355 [Candidatus Curtissbacteria bacterium RIFCSPLOWO2_12_FULL_38_9]